MASQLNPQIVWVRLYIPGDGNILLQDARWGAVVHHEDISIKIQSQKCINVEGINNVKMKAG